MVLSKKMQKSGKVPSVYPENVPIYAPFGFGEDS